MCLTFSPCLRWVFNTFILWWEMVIIGTYIQNFDLLSVVSKWQLTHQKLHCCKYICKFQDQGSPKRINVWPSTAALKSYSSVFYCYFNHAYLAYVVKNLKRNKSPGADGLTSEFCQTFWEELKLIFMKMLTESFERGILPDSTKKSIILLIFKKGDKTLLQD